MKILLFFVTILIFLPFTGCGGDGLNRTSVNGKVTFDGKPIESGFIMFKPEPGTQCPDIGGQIKGGTYHIPQKDGPVTGSYTVGIMASVPTGKKIKAPITGIETDEMVQIIPPQYTGIMGKSSLTTNIEKGKNERNFDIVSDKENR
ncbi:MAG: hypothetical protein LBE12_03705 [Planctomycetaceae bacterium]|jgi:hypothetical protein|nr:hypothetical protein [Planctomycetaceae bacterium]